VRGSSLVVVRFRPRPRSLLSLSGGRSVLELVTRSCMNLLFWSIIVFCCSSIFWRSLSCVDVIVAAYSVASVSAPSRELVCSIICWLVVGGLLSQMFDGGAVLSVVVAKLLSLDVLRVLSLTWLALSNPLVRASRSSRNLRLLLYFVTKNVVASVHVCSGFSSHSFISFSSNISLACMFSTCVCTLAG